jgi:hypothetical protein
MLTEKEAAALICAEQENRPETRRKPELSEEEIEKLLDKGRQIGLEIEQDLRGCIMISNRRMRYRVR